MHLIIGEKWTVYTENARFGIYDMHFPVEISSSKSVEGAFSPAMPYERTRYICCSRYWSYDSLCMLTIRIQQRQLECKGKSHNIAQHLLFCSCVLGKVDVSAMISASLARRKCISAYLFRAANGGKRGRWALPRPAVWAASEVQI